MLLRICLIIAILGGGAVVAVNFLKVQPALVQVISDRDQETKVKKETQATLATTKKTLADTQGKLDTTTKALTQTKSQLDSAKSQVADLNTKNSDLDTKLKDAQAKRDDFQAQLAKWDQLHLTPTDVIQIQTDLKKSTTAIAGLTEEKKLLFSNWQEDERKIKELVGTATDVILPTGLRGKVLAVDPKYDFVVLDIGGDKGVLTKGVMMVARDGKLIGKVQIARVDKTQSIANVLPGWRRGDIMEGDEVLY